MVKYYPLRPAHRMNLQGIALAARRVGPAFLYDLRVHPDDLLTARAVVREQVFATDGNPLAPSINLVADPDLAIDEWYLEANGKACGCQG